MEKVENEVEKEKLIKLGRFVVFLKRFEQNPKQYSKVVLQVETFDGFVDLIEIKRPEGKLKFWATNKDHDNLQPHQDLIAAITQVQNYIQDLEGEMNSIKTQKNLAGASIIKPRATLIYGRSDTWGDEERRAFRLLNAGYQNLSILTYDHVLSRANRSLSRKTVDKDGN